MALNIRSREAEVLATELARLTGETRTEAVTKARRGIDDPGVASRRRRVRELDRLLEVAKVEIVPVDREQALMAREAFRSFGKGRHRAGLNFGNCFAYALASIRAEPLLCKGDDFAATDVLRA